MPLISMQTSVSLDDATKDELLRDLSGAVSAATGKPEAYIMATVQSAQICMAGELGPAAYVDVRGIGGLTQGVNANISAAVARVLGERLGISRDRVYLTFTDVPASNWGWNGSTFG